MSDGWATQTALNHFATGGAEETTDGHEREEEDDSEGDARAIARNLVDTVEALDAAHAALTGADGLDRGVLTEADAASITAYLKARAAGLETEIEHRLPPGYYPDMPERITYIQ